MKKLKMLKKFVKENYEGVVCGCAAVGFILSSCALISIMTIKMAIGIILLLISVMCVLIMKKLLYIKLK